VFLLVKNLQLLDPWGDAAWGGLFAAAGLVFLASFVLDPAQWWRAIPGFVLLSIGAPVLLAWQKVQLGNWNGSTGISREFENANSLFVSTAIIAIAANESFGISQVCSSLNGSG
jgi:formate hydrogenlyase subunit 3/multisubunit Na+/H+ antiporter MnhD subunit